MNRWTGRAAQSLTRFVLVRDHHRCGWCGGPATSADHLVPRSAGGSDDPSNLMAACLPCNQSKGTGPRPARVAAAPPSRPW